MKQTFCNGMVHVIKEGETLYQLSRMYRVPVSLLLRANPYVDVYNLQPGQTVKIGWDAKNAVKVIDNDEDEKK